MAGREKYIDGGAELAVAVMDVYQRAEIGRKTLRFVRSCMRDPVLREKIQARAEQIRKEGAYGVLGSGE